MEPVALHVAHTSACAIHYCGAMLDVHRCMRLALFIGLVGDVWPRCLPTQLHIHREEHSVTGRSGRSRIPSLLYRWNSFDRRG